MEQGVTQGDTDSPIIFNIVVDAVIRHWKSKRITNSFYIFYVDDGAIKARNMEFLKKDLQSLRKAFSSVGLQINVKKTKYMTVIGGTPPKPLSNIAYNRMMTGNGLTYKERQNLKYNVLFVQRVSNTAL